MCEPGTVTVSGLPGNIFEDSKMSCWRLAVSCWPGTVCDLKRGSWRIRLPSSPARPEALSGLTANRQLLRARARTTSRFRIPPAPHLRLALNREKLNVGRATPRFSLNRASQIYGTVGPEFQEVILARALIARRSSLVAACRVGLRFILTPSAPPTSGLPGGRGE